jgi:hypothetical protein
MSSINVYGGSRNIRNIRNMNIKKESDRMLKKLLFSALLCLFISAVCVYVADRLTDPFKLADNIKILTLLTEKLHKSLIIWRNTALALQKVPQWAINGSLGSMTSMAINVGSFKSPSIKRAVISGASAAALSSVYKRESIANALTKILSSLNTSKSYFKAATSTAGRLAGVFIGTKSLASYYADLFNAIAKQCVNILIPMGFKISNLALKRIIFNMSSNTNKIKTILGPQKVNRLLSEVINKIRVNAKPQLKLTNKKSPTPENNNAARILMSLSKR